MMPYDIGKKLAFFWARRENEFREFCDSLYEIGDSENHKLIGSILIENVLPSVILGDLVRYFYKLEYKRLLKYEEIEDIIYIAFTSYNFTFEEIANAFGLPIDSVKREYRKYKEGF